MNNLSNSSFLFDTTTAANLKTFLMPLGAFVVVINACSTAALLRCKNMEAKMRQFAVCLTAIDICVGCYLMVMVFTYASNTTRNIVLCYTVLMMPRFMAYVGMLTTTAFAIDRFASIYRWHSYVITKQKTRAICGAVWLISFCTTAASFYGKRYTCDTQDEIDYDREINALLMIIPMLVCFVTIAVCYTAIYVNIRKHLSKTKDLGINRKEYAMTMFQSTVVTGILILAYLLCYGPISILKIYNYLYPETIVPTRTLRNVTQVVFVTNSLINPIIYAMRFRECRLELKHIFCFFNKVTRADIQRRKKILQAPFLEKGINVSPSTSKSNDAGPQSAYTINTHVCNSSNASPSSVHGNQPSERPAVPLPDDEHTTVEPSEHTVGVPQCLNPVSAVWTCRNYDDTLCVAEGFLSTDILKCPDDVVPACSKVIKVFPDSLSVPASTVPSNHIEYSTPVVTYNSTTFDESLV